MEQNNSVIKKAVFISVIITFFLTLILASSISVFTSYLSTKYLFKSNGQGSTENTTINQTVEVEEESAVTKVVETTGDSVVSIVISKDVPIFETYFGDSFNDPFFMQPQYKQNGTEKQEIGAGTGFIVSKDGYIVTNKHVVEEEDVEYTVFLQNGDKHEAKILGKDPANDLAILKIEAKNLKPAELGNSENLKPGQTVVAIGYALGEFKNTVSKGVVSGLGRSITASDNYGQNSEELENIIQTDAAINQGNSGGPLLNIQGQVIAINVAMSMAGENIAFAIPINDAKKVINDVKEKGRIVRPYLGIRYALINETIKENNQLSVDYGALVIRGENLTDLAVFPDSPAAKAGVEENDIILEADDEKINADNDLSKMLAKKSVGDKIKFKILHDGEESEIEIELEEWKTE